uniref:N-acetyltransferase domain-containing protein n=2 Tax=Ciona intestinalis TaxID=7719 RepID=H2XKH5_CIOIN
MDEAEWKEEFKEKGCTLIPGKLLSTLNEDLGKIIGSKLYLRVSISTVKPSYGRMGIMSGLRKRIELVAKDLGCEFIVSESTSLYTQRIASKLGYTTENEIKYSGYFDPLSGTYIFKHIPAPHQSVKLLVKSI